MHVNEQIQDLLPFSAVEKRQFSVQFSEEDTSSDGGLILMREMEQQTGIIKTVSEAVVDRRHASYIRHSYNELISQRILQLVTGYEDCNDSDFLKNDPLLKIAVKNNVDSRLGSQPTMSRLENSVSRSNLLRLAYGIGDNFLNSFSVAPKAIIIDMDPTENRVYGDQQLALFNGFTDDYCFMPFHVYDGISGQLITTVLRPGKTPSGEEIVTILKRIIQRIQDKFPTTALIFRADSHHCRKEVLDYLEDKQLYYILGLSKNLLPKDNCKALGKRALQASRLEFSKVRLFHSFFHKVSTWRQPRRIICRVEANAQEADRRYIVTNLKGKTKFLYEKLYCDRANAQLKIKDSKAGLHSDRTSCHRKEANQFRLLLNAAAYQLMHSFRHNVLIGTQWAKSTFKTIQLKIFKVAATLQIKKTFIRVTMPRSCVAQKIYARLSGICLYLNKT